jgi:hypothetical protein
MLEIVDINGCVSETVPLYANVYQVIVDSINYEDVDCYNYTDAEISVSGRSPHPVTWKYIDSTNFVSPSYSSGAKAFVGGGYYEIIATDTAGCTSVKYLEPRFFSVYQPEPIRITERSFLLDQAVTTLMTPLFKSWLPVVILMNSCILSTTAVTGRHQIILAV